MRESKRYGNHIMRHLVLRALQSGLLPLIALCSLEASWKGGRWFAASAELLSMVPGRIGSMVRKAFYAATIRHCATRAYISFGVLLSRRDVSVGEDVYIGPYSIIGSAMIGDRVKIASRVSITSGRHQHGRYTVAVDPTPRLQPVSIGADSWIGEGAIVMADIGERCIVGAGSVVTRSVGDGQVVVGNPARPLSRTISRRAIA